MPQAKRTSEYKTSGALISILAEQAWHLPRCIQSTVWVQRVHERKTSASHERVSVSILTHSPSVTWSKASDLHLECMRRLTSGGWSIESAGT